jgi:hypothetical protein
MAEHPPDEGGPVEPDPYMEDDDTDSMAGLDPSHPLLVRAQAALKHQLVEARLRVEGVIREKTEDLRVRLRAVGGSRVHGVGLEDNGLRWARGTLGGVRLSQRAAHTCSSCHWLRASTLQHKLALAGRGQQQMQAGMVRGPRQGTEAVAAECP